MNPRLGALLATLGVAALSVGALTLALSERQLSKRAPSATAAAPAPQAAEAQTPAATPADSRAAFAPPSLSEMPTGPFGDMVKLGYEIFTDTPRYAKAYVGNTLSCQNCHLAAGRLADAAPMWAAYVSYPEYRSKNHHVNTFEERLQGCFRFSMNGKAPPQGGKVLVALESYAFWMAKGAPTDTGMKGRGYPTLPPPAQPPDYARGKAVYAAHCALCHQPGGQGLNVAGRTQFPPLWGADSFNWGAGLQKVDTAAAFIKANMPLGLGDSLGDQQAWDVAMYVDSHERPQDPRYTGSIAATRRKYHDSKWSMYGRSVNGKLLGQGILPPSHAPH